MILFVVTVALIGYTSAQTGLCPQSSGDFPNPSSEQCTTFFRCVKGNPNLLRCPANQRFDFLFRICRSQEQVNCNDQLQIYAAPANGNGLGGLSGGAGPLNGAGGIGFGGTGGLGGTLGGLGGGLGGLGGGLGGLGGGLGGLGGLAGLGGGLAGLGGLGVGLPQGGLINLILSRRSGDGDGGDGGNLALIAAMTQLMNQRRATPLRAPQAPQVQVPTNQVIPLYNTQQLSTGTATRQQLPFGNPIQTSLSTDDRRLLSNTNGKK